MDDVERATRCAKAVAAALTRYGCRIVGYVSCGDRIQIDVTDTLHADGYRVSAKIIPDADAVPHRGVHQDVE